MWRVGCVSSLAIFAGAVFAAVPAAIAAPSGVVVAVIQSAEVDGETGRKMLRPEAPVFSGDQILTGTVGEAQLRFRDNTKLVVGPNSKMVIDAFVFNNDDTARKVSMTAVRGAFRFISGKSKKDAYDIVTPTATIGIRGTAFDFSVDPSGGTRVAMFAGSTNVCDRQRRNCVLQTASCNIAAVDQGKKPRRVLASLDRQREITQNFRYVRSQASLRQEFKVNVSSCRIERAEAPDTKEATIIVETVLTEPPPPPDPTETGSIGNHSGHGDGSNPGNGSSNSNSPNAGASNPGGGKKTP